MTTLVALVGRPNAGKSTLFNAMAKGQRARRAKGARYRVESRASRGHPRSGAKGGAVS